VMGPPLHGGVGLAVGGVSPAQQQSWRDRGSGRRRRSQRRRSPSAPGPRRAGPGSLASPRGREAWATSPSTWPRTGGQRPLRPRGNAGHAQARSSAASTYTSWWVSAQSSRCNWFRQRLHVDSIISRWRSTAVRFFFHPRAACPVTRRVQENGDTSVDHYPGPRHKLADGPFAVCPPRLRRSHLPIAGSRAHQRVDHQAMVASLVRFRLP
jgi:hypothetical protein